MKASNSMEIDWLSNRKIEWDQFQKLRREVLAQWPTGQQVDLDEAIAYHKSMPDSKNTIQMMRDAKKNGYTLIHSNMGYTTLEQNLELHRYIQDVGRGDFVRTILDSFSRTHRFAKAEEAVKECERTGENLLNGFPAQHYGVSGCRKLVEASRVPVHMGGPTVDSRLVYEICLAAGYTQAEPGGAMTGYSKKGAFETGAAMSLYGIRLAAHYNDHGVPILCGFMMGIKGSHIPGITPCSLKIVSSVMDALSTGAQGYKYAMAGSVSQGNLVQDLATNIADYELVMEYLDRFGYKDVEVFLSNGHIDGPYPTDHAQSIVSVVFPAIIPALTKAQTCWIKTVDEADAIPTKENSAFSLRAVRMMIDIFKDQNIDLVNSKEVREEAERQKREARAIIDKTLEIGNGNPLIGQKRAIELGVLDWPLPNNQNLKGQVIGCRDATGAVRYLDFGNLPLTKEMKDFHRQKLAERARKIGKQPDYDTIVADMLAISRGSLVPTIA
jgi:methylaspartate mutase epsilon subunit